MESVYTSIIMIIMIILYNNNKNSTYSVEAFTCQLLIQQFHGLLFYISLVAKWHRFVPWSTKGLYENGKVYNDL